MACSSPLLGYRMSKVNSYTGEIETGRFRGDEFSHQPLVFQDKRFSFISSKQYPDKADRYDLFNRLKVTPGYEVAELPCGRCLECRLEYARQWANRCMLEASLFPDNWFITLTYDDDHLPKNKDGYPTLRADDLKKFNKDLRAYFKYHYNHDNIRFFASGEYGDTSARPHYHVIFFNLPLIDLEYFFSRGDKSFFKSQVISDIWSKGNVLLSPVDWDNCAYTAKYVVKKAKGETSSVYKELDIEPEFCRMSRRPGIAHEYFIAHLDLIYKYDSLSIPGVGKVRPSHYYDKLFDILDPSSLYSIKEKRVAVAQARNDIELSGTSLSPLEYAQQKHDALVKKIASLKRNQI